jgi:hypothetical protein
MNTVATSKELRELLAFPSPAAYLGFLLTCLDTPELSRGTEVYQQHLSRVHIPRSGAQRLLVSLRCDVERARQAAYVALANGGTVQKMQPLEREQFHVLTVPQLLRAIRLHSVPRPLLRPGRLLVALWGAHSDALAEFLEHCWNLGLEGIEIAFLRVAHRAAPSHLIRVQASQRVEAFHAFCEGFEGRLEHLELYAPVRGERGDSRFYTRWGYRFPAPGLEQLAELDRELILLRPKGEGKHLATEWITFAEGEINFFRRAYDFVDLELSLDETPLIELHEDVSPPQVPMELAMITRPKSSMIRLWQIDQQIDRQRRALLDLERMRARLAAGQWDEIYFAYRFEQADEQGLNPRLVRLLQQRISTLNHYDYAYCHPKGGCPYHLVLANRPQRQMGFSLQAADAVYYQPASWRRWGLNLFLPLHSELAPQIDDSDALPLLQRILDENDRTSRHDLPVQPAAECAAILWDPGTDGEIAETRITETAPLLSRFHLLNSFQRRVAGQVEQATREQLAEGIQTARRRVEDELDALTRELLEHVGGRTEKLELSYARLEESLQAAERLVSRVEPRIEEIRKLVLTLPEQWVQFVEGVIGLHHSLVKPELLELDALGQRRLASRQQLRALAVRGKDLSARAEAHRAGLEREVVRHEQAIVGQQQIHRDLEQLHERATRVIAEIRVLHQMLAQRLDRIRKMERTANKLQREIDQIDERENQAKQRLVVLKPLLAEYQQKAAEIEKAHEDLSGQEQKLLQQSLELAERREQLAQRTRQLAGQLEQIEAYLATCGARSEEIAQASTELTERLDLVAAHSEAITMWDTQRKSWENHLALEQEEDVRKIDLIQRALADWEAQSQVSATVRQELELAQNHLNKAEELRRKTGSDNP